MSNTKDKKQVDERAENKAINLRLALTTLRNPLNRRMEVDEILRKIRDAVQLLKKVLDTE